MGGDGADTMYGWGGGDHMTGGEGDDNYYVDNVGDMVTEAFDEGTDTIYAAINVTLPANVEYLFTFAAGDSGNTQHDVITISNSATILPADYHFL